MVNIWLVNGVEKIEVLGLRCVVGNLPYYAYAFTGGVILVGYDCCGFYGIGL